MSVLLASEDFLVLVETWALAVLEEEQASERAADLFARIERDREFSRICDSLVLSRGDAELVVLLLAAGRFQAVARTIRQLSPHSEARGVPTWLALDVLPHGDEIDISGAANLRLLACIEVEQDVLPVEAHLRLSSAIADRLAGTPSTDPLVAAHMSPLPVSDNAISDVGAERFARALSMRNASGLSPLLLAGSASPDRIAANLMALDLSTWRIFAQDIPDDQSMRNRLARAWSRDAAYSGMTLVVISDVPAPEAKVVDFVDRVLGHVVLVGEPPSMAPRRDVTLVLYGDEEEDGQLREWHDALGAERVAKVGPRLDAIVRQFALRAPEISALCRDHGAEIDAAECAHQASAVLWHNAARVVGPESVPGVELVEPGFDWDDIVLPEAIELRLHRIEGHVRHASQVMDEWGFAARMGGRGRGISVLLSGQSGTGKSMAAEVLANALDLRVMFIDLSQLISKYIGDTSKNVAAVFRLAERSGAVMVWNEGDAIWGARGSIGNATDRHVNAEVGDLLQRIENFRGFTIVTTNMRHAIDEAFTRRFRFCLDFPVPGERERKLIWEKAFPASAPVGDVDWAALAKVQLTGGSIRNIALSSAFCAAELGRDIDREIIAAEVVEEFRKQDRPAPAIEWGSATS